MTKTEFTDAHETVSAIDNLMTQAGALLDKLPPPIQAAILAYHNDRATLQHCLRWGQQAASEIRADWHTVVAGLPCAEEKP